MVETAAVDSARVKTRPAPTSTQGLLADVAADDGGVYGVIELLEEVAQDHGQGKDEQCLQGHVRYQVISFHDWSRP